MTQKGLSGQVVVMCAGDKSVIWEKFRSDLIPVYELDLQQPQGEMMRGYDLKSRNKN